MINYKYSYFINRLFTSKNRKHIEVRFVHSNIKPYNDNAAMYMYKFYVEIGNIIPSAHIMYGLYRFFNTSKYAIIFYKNLAYKNSYYERNFPFGILFTEII
jgi:hypothetical protein